MMITRGIKVHAKSILLKYASRFAYRFDFLIGFSTGIFFQLLGPIFFGIAYYAGAQVPGWTLNQVMLLQGVLSIVRGFTFMFFIGMLWNTIKLVQSGNFEILLLRPIPVLWQLIISGFDEEDVGQLVGGIAITTYTIHSLHLGSFSHVFLPFLGLIFLGIGFFFFLSVMCAALTLKFVETWRLYEFIDGIFTLASYPRTVYGKNFSLLFTVIIPIFLTSYYPAAALLGFSIQGIGWSVLALGVMGIVAGYSWKLSLNRYRSAGG